MPRVHTASTCQWAVPTLTTPGAEWLQAVDCEWTCTRAGQSEPLLSTDRCTSCPEWQPRPAHKAGADEREWADHVVHPLMPDIIVRPF